MDLILIKQELQMHIDKYEKYLSEAKDKNQDTAFIMGQLCALYTSYSIVTKTNKEEANCVDINT